MIIKIRIKIFSGIDDLKVCLCIFNVSEYHNSRLQLFKCERETIWKFVAEEMYYGLISSC